MSLSLLKRTLNALMKVSSYVACLAPQYSHPTLSHGKLRSAHESGNIAFSPTHSTREGLLPVLDSIG